MNSLFKKGEVNMAKKLEKVNVTGAAGTFLVVDGILSILMSTDQRPICTFGRLIRISIGAGLALYKYS